MLCILLVYIHIVGWCTVRAALSRRSIERYGWIHRLWVQLSGLKRSGRESQHSPPIQHLQLCLYHPAHIYSLRGGKKYGTLSFFICKRYQILRPINRLQTVFLLRNNHEGCTFLCIHVLVVQQSPSGPGRPHYWSFTITLRTQHTWWDFSGRVISPT